MKVALLSDMSAEELNTESRSLSYPKWSTLCALAAIKAPCLDAVWVPPTSSKAEIFKFASAFIRKHGLARVLLRSDGGIETTGYLRGGNSYPWKEAVEIATQVSANGRAVLFMEPTCRFNNKMSINCLVSKPDVLHLDILGGGHDVSDLNRGNVLPQMMITLNVSSWDHFETICRADIIATSANGNDEARVSKRLENMARHILPAIGVSVEGEPLAFAEQWLRTQGFDELWASGPPIVTLSSLRNLYEVCFFAARHVSESRSWTDLCLSYSLLEDREVWWDIVDGQRKYGR